MTSTNRFLSRTVFSTLMLTLAMALFANPTWAQDDQSDEAEDSQTTEEEAVELDRVQVTGSLLKREDFTSTSPVQIVTAETQAQVGQLDIADILQNSTVASGTTQLANQWNGFVVQGGTGVQTLDLRGLGDNRTLLLLNGRRPGGSGTRGQTQALDLSMLPEIAIQRAEFVLDGSSSIYGSDAVAGVANVITRRSVDGFEVQALTDLPESSGGEMYRVGLMTGWNFDKGNATLSAQWQKREALTTGDRHYFACTQDRFWDEDGNRIDRWERSARRSPNDPNGYGCYDMWINLVVDHWDGGYLIPSPDGVTEGPLDGYRYRNNGRYDDPGGVAYYEDQYEIDQFDSEMVLNEQERMNIYATLDYTFDFWGGVDWDADFLYSNRQTKSEGWRQFFPIVGSAWAAPYGFGYENDPDWNPEILLPIGQPVIPYPSNSQIDVDYFFFTTGLEGLLPTDSYWSWQIYGTYSYSDGSYGGNGILTSRSGDWAQSVPDAPPINFYDPAILGGQNMQSIVDAIGVDHKGNTVYDQLQVVGILSGDLFQMPAGAVGTAFGLEYRDFSINDQPSSYSREGELWGSSSALVTKGSNNVWEAFVEAEIPLLAGKTGFEELTLNVSGRYFDYKEGGSDTVWKAGLRWALTPTVLLRGTMGTSYRAPALFELYLGDETGFVGQAGIDPCVNWGDSTNDNIRTNCAAEGIPDDYTGLGSSATVISGGGAGFLEPETSDAMTFGLVWTPEFSDLSIAVDYVEIEVNNQIDDLGASAIVSGCYNAQNFPNSFCDLFSRLPVGDPFEYNITEIHDAFINVNEQLYKGIDLNLVWNIDLSFGQLELAAQSTWNLENTQRLFDPSEVEGFDTTDYVGTIGSPDNTTNFRTSLNWQDWRFNYYLQYVSKTDDSPFVNAERSSYYGYGPAFVDITMDSVLYHNLSVIYQRDDWDVLVGVNNLFDEAPDTVSDVYRALRGNVPISASQYDLLGRSYFMRLNYRF